MSVDKEFERLLEESSLGTMGIAALQKLAGEQRYCVTHEESAECVGEHCASCGVDESAAITTYRVCLECGHVFPTPEDLVSAARIQIQVAFATTTPAEGDDEMWRGEELLPTEVGQVTFCPLCMHDF